MGRVFLAAALALFVSGFLGCTVKPPEGQLECESDEDCPPNWVCNDVGDSTCYESEDHFPSTDSDTDSDSDTDTDTDSDTDADECADVAFSFDFESGGQGFAHDALPDGNPDPWERGTPNDQDCSSGDNCWATVLDGDYESCVSAELVSPLFDLSSCADDPLDVVLRFQHHYLFQPQLFDTFRDGGLLQLSSDGGDTWQDAVASQDYDGEIAGDYGGPCNNVEPDIAGHDAWSGEIAGSGWSEVSVTLGDEHKTEEFRFRFLFGSDRTWQETGWVIDDIELVAE